MQDPTPSRRCGPSQLSGELNSWMYWSSSKPVPVMWIYASLERRVPQPTAANLVIQHGCLRGGALRTVVDDIQSFLQNHKGEFVVLEVTPEYGQFFADGDKRACLSLLHEAFDEMLLRVDDLKAAIRSKTIKHIVQEDHCRLAVLLHNRFFSGRDANDDLTEASIRSQFGFGNSNRFMHNKWHNTRSVDGLLESNLEEVRKHGTDRNTKLLTASPSIIWQTEFMRLVPLKV
jgi:hypothetical protein